VVTKRMWHTQVVA